MCSKREVLIFLAGASTFHTISHIVLNFAGILPLKFDFMGHVLNITQQFNIYAIIANIIITLALFWWISRLK